MEFPKVNSKNMASGIWIQVDRALEDKWILYWWLFCKVKFCHATNMKYEHSMGFKKNFCEVVRHVLLQRPVKWLSNVESFFRLAFSIIFAQWTVLQASNAIKVADGRLFENLDLRQCGTFRLWCTRHLSWDAAKCDVQQVDLKLRSKWQGLVERN